MGVNNLVLLYYGRIKKIYMDNSGYDRYRINEVSPKWRKPVSAY